MFNIDNCKSISSELARRSNLSEATSLEVFQWKMLLTERRPTNGSLLAKAFGFAEQISNRNCLIEVSVETKKLVIRYH